MIGRNRLKIAVRDMHTFKLVLLDQFDSKAELVDANLASAHIPFFLDWKPFAVYRYSFMLKISDCPHALLQFIAVCDTLSPSSFACTSEITSLQKVMCSCDCRGRRYVDGSLQDAWRGKHSDKLTDDGRSFVMDYHQARPLPSASRSHLSASVKALVVEGPLKGAFSNVVGRVWVHIL